MPFDPLKLLDWVAPPVGALAVGWAAQALRLGRRLTDLEREHKEHVAKSEDWRKGVRLELDSLKEELDAQLATLAGQAARLRDSQVDYAKDAELANFVTEMHARWTELQRTLGRIEGELTARGHLAPRPSSRDTPPPSTRRR